LASSPNLHLNVGSRVARALPERSVMSVFERARRTLNSKEKKGAWDEQEEALLLEYRPKPLRCASSCLAY
jgi:tRNA(Glu) U13 pseudouridine synthase TruD